MAKTFEQLVPAPAGRFDGISRPYTPAEVREAAGLRADRLHPGRKGRQSALGVAEERAVHQFARRRDRQPGDAAGARRPAGDLSVGLAGRRRRQHRRGDVSRPEPLSGQCRPRNCAAASTAPSSVPTRSSTPKAAPSIDWFVPIVADAEAGFGGPLNSFEIMKAYIEAGAAGVHFEDQLASEKKCGHMGGKVLIPTAAHERNLIAARLAADVCGTPTFVLARTDAESAKLITADVDERDRAVHHRRAHRGRLLSAQARHGPRPLHHARHRVRAIRRPAVVGDLDTRTSRRRASSPRPCTRSIPARCWPTTARPRSTGKPISTRRPSPNSSAKSARWATSSSSSRWRVSTRSTTACSSSRAATRTEGMAAYSAPAAGRIRIREARLFGDAPSARSRHRLLRSGVDDHHRRRVIDHRARTTPPKPRSSRSTARNIRAQAAE